MSVEEMFGKRIVFESWEEENLSHTGRVLYIPMYAAPYTGRTLLKDSRGRYTAVECEINPRDFRAFLIITDDREVFTDGIHKVQYLPKGETLYGRVVASLIDPPIGEDREGMKDEPNI